MGGLKFGVNRPADSNIAVDQPPKGLQQPCPYLPRDASQSCTKIRLPSSLSPEPQLVLGLQPTGKPSRREEVRSCSSDEVTLSRPHYPQIRHEQVGRFCPLPQRVEWPPGGTLAREFPPPNSLARP